MSASVALAIAGAAPDLAHAAPSVSWNQPLNGATLRGRISGSMCAVAANSETSRVSFYATNWQINNDYGAPFNCDFDTTRLKDGAYTLRARAFNTAGAYTDRSINITIANNTAAPTPTAEPAPAPTPTTQPTSTTGLPVPGTGSLEAWFEQPRYGSTVSGTIQLGGCYLRGSGFVRANFFLDSTPLNSDNNAADGVSCVLDTTRFANGTHLLRAMVYDAAGNSYHERLSINIQNVAAAPAPTPAPTPTTSLPSTGVRAVPTFESLGLYWRPGTNPGAAGCPVQYRAAGESAWRQAMPMWFDGRNSECRGSLVNLRPGTQYEVQLGLPRQAFSRAIVAKTWSEQFPIARVVHVQSGSSQLNITQGGTPDGYVLYTPAPGTQATLDVRNNADHNVRISAPYVIVRGFTMRGARMDAVRMYAGAHDVVIENNDISGWGRSRGGSLGVDGDSAVRAICTSDSWRMERVIVQNNRLHHPRYGSNSWSSGHPEGPQAITFRECGANHVFRYNDIYSSSGHYWNDAIGGSNNFSNIGFPYADTDIYGNRISQAYDDGIEAEGANRNTRIWGNYITDTFIAIASSSTHVGPFYVFRNVYNQGGTFGKSGDNNGYGGGRRYFFHNTTLQGGSGANAGIKGNTNQPMTNTVSRNNVWHMRNAGNMAIGVIGGSLNDFNYDLSNGNMTPYSGAEANGIVGIPTYASGHGAASGSGGYYQLAPGSRGYDSGTRLPNFNDDFTGAAPDMGAAEAGKPPMRFGVR